LELVLNRIGHRKLKTGGLQAAVNFLAATGFILSCLAPPSLLSSIPWFTEKRVKRKKKAKLMESKSKKSWWVVV